MSVEDLERRVRLLCTDELGVVRVAEAAGRSKIDDLAFAKRWGDADRSRRVVRCRAGEDGDGDGDALGGRGTCAAAGWLALGRKDGTAEVIDTATGGDVGAGREGARLVTVTDAGEAAVYGAACDAGVAGDGSLASHLAPLRVVQEWSPACAWKACGSARVARASPRARALAVGGEGQGNDLKLYDVETQKVRYKAKPPPENWLGYRAPPFVSALEFVPGTDGACVLVGTGERRVRLYDTRVDKRATVDLEVGETTVTALAMNASGQFAFVGNAKGQLQTVDLRARGVFAKFKGAQGSIREIAPHPGGEALVAVAGLDRYLRVYHTETRKCLGSAFMKQALSGCAWDVRGPETEFAAAAAEAAARRRREKAEKRERKAAGGAEEKKAKKKATEKASREEGKGKKLKRASAGAEGGVPAKKKKKKKAVE